MGTEEQYIKIFGPDHVLYIVGFIFLAYLLFAKRDIIKKNRDKVDKVLLVITIIQQTLLYGAYYVYLGFDLSESLPFHVCRICSFFVMAFLITKNQKAFEVMTFFGFFALLSFLYPSKVYNLSHPIGYSFLISHTTNLLAASYGILIHDMKLNKNSKNRSFVYFLLYLALVVIINPIVDGNYFYLKHKPILAFLPNIIYVPIVSFGTYLLFSICERLHFYVQDKYLAFQKKKEKVKSKTRASGLNVITD